MMDEPTRGIDVGAKYEIYELIINMAKQFLKTAGYAMNVYHHIWVLNLDW